jgi:DMSO/TMAO reductase YedYZ molybdopterin-dependent catalytic subunit
MSTAPTRLRPPVNTIPASAQSHTGQLEIRGRVSHPRTLSGADLAPLRRIEQVEEFVGKDGGRVVRRWRGMLLLEVLALAQPGETACYVRVCAGSYALPLALAKAHAALLCDELDGQPLAQRQGAPWRLLLPGGHAHTSVKWIDRLEVTEERGSYDAGCGRTR